MAHQHDQGTPPPDSHNLLIQECESNMLCHGRSKPSWVNGFLWPACLPDPRQLPIL